MDIKAFRGLSGTYNVRANERDRGAPRNIQCLVQFLNNTQQTFVVDRGSKGQILLDCVFKHLNLIETDFFGLKYSLSESHFHKSDSNVALSSNIVSSKTQSLNSEDQSPSPNASLLSSSGAHPVTTNHKSLSLNSSKNANLNDSISETNNIISIDKQNDSNTENNLSNFLEERWLDPTKSIRKQYKSGPPFKFYFRVKFYVSDPCKLADDTTRNHLYLQLRHDILNNRLTVPTCSAILLASYILQSECGDYKRELIEENYATNIRLLPNQSDDIKRKVIELHKTHKSLSPADAEYQFLEHAAKKLDCYGVEFYQAKDSLKTNIQIGVSSNGVVVFKDNKRMNQFSWAKIIKIMFKKKIFSILLRSEEGQACDNFIEFNLLTNQACKSFWEECVAQHSFFRLHQPKSPPKRFFSFLNFGSKFQYNGKTEYQTMEESRKRSTSHFSRSPSKRYARRTIPVGKPSWTEQTCIDDKRNCSNDELDCNENGIESAETRLCSPLSTSGPSSSVKTSGNHMTNGFTNESRLAYRPKSLTLKSFVYIDETRNGLSSEGNMKIEDRLSSKQIDNLDRHSSQDTDERQVTKRDLKRSGSLRLPNPIKGAFSLTKKAGLISSSQLSKVSESLREKFLSNKSIRRSSGQSNGDPSEINHNDSDYSSSENNFKIVRLMPGEDGKYGFKIRKLSKKQSSRGLKKSERHIVIHGVSPNSPAALSDPRLCEGDQLHSINGVSTEGLSETKVENLIKSIQHQQPPNLILEVTCKSDSESASLKSLCSSNGTKPMVSVTLANSIKSIKKGLGNEQLIKEFEKLSRKKEDESLDESKTMENIDKNRYRDILPYDSTRVQLIDSMTGDYINASFVDMAVPSGQINRYIATQGPLSSTCVDFWQMVWEQNSSLIIMVTPLIEGGRVKCHKYWPDAKGEERYGQLFVKNLREKSKVATIDRTIQLVDVKSGETRTTTQIQYKAWPDHEVPEDCSDFLKLVKRVRQHRIAQPRDPIVVHCSAGIGRTGVLILMETAICIMESGEPINPISILEDMRKQRAMLIQTNSQFQFVAEAICKVYDQKLYKRTRKSLKK